MKLDLAVVKLLGLDPDKTNVSSACGSGSSAASTSKIVSHLDDGTEKAYFMKTGSGKEAGVMFEGMRNPKCARHR
jgi:protein-ribulosamine 3-kinase